MASLPASYEGKQKISSAPHAFKGEWDEVTASKLLAAAANQDRHVEFGDIQRALMHLPQP